MKTRWLFVPALFAVVMTSASARADQKKHEEKFCGALAAVSADLATLRDLKRDSTVGEVRVVLKRLRSDAQMANDQARKIDTPAAKQLVRSTAELDREVNGLPDTATLEEARTRLHDEMADVKRDTKALAAESGCPESIPEENPKP